jgi:hypothetical protein
LLPPPLLLFAAVKPCNNEVYWSNPPVITQISYCFQRLECALEQVSASSGNTHYVWNTWEEIISIKFHKSTETSFLHKMEINIEVGSTAAVFSSILASFMLYYVRCLTMVYDINLWWFCSVDSWVWAFLIFSTYLVKELLL